MLDFVKTSDLLLCYESKLEYCEKTIKHKTDLYLANLAVWQSKNWFLQLFCTKPSLDNYDLWWYEDRIEEFKAKINRVKYHSEMHLISLPDEDQRKFYNWYNTHVTDLK